MSTLAPSTRSSCLLEVCGLTFSYGEMKVVDDVSFSMRKGEITGLLGPNGAGKTTAIKCLCGLKTQYSGQILYEGEAFTPHKKPSQRQRLGVVPQDLALYDTLSGKENLRFFGTMADLRGNRLENAVEAALDLSGLHKRKDDLVRTYSGGMKRRLNLAVANLHNPEILILDEPTVGVDPQSRNHIFETIEAQRELGTTILYTTHYMEEAERLCDRIGIMDTGRIIKFGTQQEIVTESGVPNGDLEEAFLALTGKQLRDT